jgi:hypothetical protein
MRCARKFDYFVIILPLCRPINPKRPAGLIKTFQVGKEEEGTFKIIAWFPLKIELEFERDKLDGKFRKECMTPKEYLWRTF